MVAGFLLAVILAGCVLTRTGAPLPSPTPPPNLTLQVLYPVEDSHIAAGEILRFTLLVTDRLGAAADDAAVRLSLQDQAGAEQASLDLSPGGQGVFRSPAWIVPEGASAGMWTAEFDASLGAARAQTWSRVHVDPSLSWILQDKYGFWIDPPVLRGIVPSLVAERGDARDGMIRWGGSLPAAHVLPSAWVDVQWRAGDYDLETAGSALRFLLEEIGDLGFSRVRSLGEPQPTEFKGWDGWTVPAQGQLRYEEVEWLIFYVPEVKRTFAIGTTVVLPPEGIDAHHALRSSFEVDAEVDADGVAPEPLPHLLPGPTLESPALGEAFYGDAARVVLSWVPLRPLREDEHYEVSVDFAYAESTKTERFTTRQARQVLPAVLFMQPNCGVFNWTVRLMRSAHGGTGAPAEEALSYPSLYSYVLWLHPPSEPAPFPPLCPNAQT
jgi:hypothetical protein